MFKLHSVWCQVFNIKQFGEFCYLKQKGFRFIPDFHSRNLLYGLEPLKQRKKEKDYWRSDHLPFSRKSHGSSHAFQNCSTVGGVSFCCRTRKSPFCLELLQGPIGWFLFLFFWKHGARDSSDDKLLSSLCLMHKYILPTPCVCKVKFAAKKRIKNREAN